MARASVAARDPLARARVMVFVEGGSRVLRTGRRVQQL